MIIKQNRVALTSANPFTGCTYIGQGLTHYGYTHVSMSSILIDMYIKYVSDISNGLITPTHEHIVSYKELYRKELAITGIKQHAELIERVLAASSRSNIVLVEKVRTNQQALDLKAEGFTIIKIERPYHQSYKYAQSKGYTRDSLKELYQKQTNFLIDDQLIDKTLTNADGYDIVREVDELAAEIETVSHDRV